MTRELWFQLVGEHGNALTSADCVDCADDAKVFRLRQTVKEMYKDSYLAGIAASDLTVFANGVALKSSATLVGLGKDEGNALIVQVLTRQRREPRSLVGISLTYADGINPARIHFDRDLILTRIAEWITGKEGKNRFLLLNSPAASGKTSLLILFQHKYPDLKSVYISLKEDCNPWDLLSRFGLDIRTRTCAFDHVVYILDDAQCRYDNPSFWDVLIKDAPLYFGAGVRFIISVTHVISTQEQSSPVYFQALETITREDMFLSDEQSLVLLRSQQSLGLPTCMQHFSELKKTIIQHCNGLIGALCKSVAFYADQFRDHVPIEVECLRAFYSKKLLGHMGRCFGTVDRTRLSAETNDALLRCVLGERIHSIRHVNQCLLDVLASFAKAGILKIDAQRYYVFSSLLAKRFFMDCYFPFRTDNDPLTLCELVMKAIQSMSATSLASSTPSPEDFPKETAFQHLFAVGLLQNTTFDTAICSELSRSSATYTNVKGGIDFFLHGDHMWGIELVRTGSKIGEHMNRFGPEGKYAGLQSSHYIALDFCRGISDVRQDPRRATASFPIDDATGKTRFGEVVVTYGEEDAIILPLQP